MLAQWLVILPISVATAVSYGALIILFTDLSTENTKGEIMGITAAINAFAFGAISFIGGGLTAIEEKIPLIVSFVMMFLSWVVLEFRKSQGVMASASAASRRHPPFAEIPRASLACALPPPSFSEASEDPQQRLRKSGTPVCIETDLERRAHPLQDEFRGEVSALPCAPKATEFHLLAWGSSLPPLKFA
jgi:hypothetical protein